MVIDTMNLRELGEGITFIIRKQIPVFGNRLIDFIGFELIRISRLYNFEWSMYVRIQLSKEELENVFGRGNRGY